MSQNANQNGYTDPQFNFKQDINAGITTAGTGTYAHYRHYRAATVLEAKAMIRIAGTASYDISIYKGTTSVGSISIASAAAIGLSAEASLTDTDIAATDVLAAKVVGDDTGVTEIYLTLKDIPA